MTKTLQNKYFSGLSILSTLKKGAILRDITSLHLKTISPLEFGIYYISIIKKIIKEKGMY